MSGSLVRSSTYGTEKATSEPLGDSTNVWLLSPSVNTALRTLLYGMHAGDTTVKGLAPNHRASLEQFAKDLFG